MIESLSEITHFNSHLIESDSSLNMNGSEWK